jgi:RNA polymerase sigma factor (TIGR02999 family)
MKTLSSAVITHLLIAWGEGDKDALDKLIPIVHDELRRLATRQMRRGSQGNTLQTTALVNEAYCKLVNQKNVRWQNRAHFFGIAAQLMRRILVDHARGQSRAKRGGGVPNISLDDSTLLSPERSAEWVVLDDALKRLAEFDPQKSRIVEMKFFGGLSNEEMAEVEQVSKRTIIREWRKARAWLFDEIHQ